MSVVTLIELAHGVARANTPQRKAMRQQFLNELIAALPVPSLRWAVKGLLPALAADEEEDEEPGS